LLTSLKITQLEKVAYYFLKVILLAVVYFVAGQVSFYLAGDLGINPTIIFVSGGIGVAVAILLGRKLWLGVFIGQLVLSLSLDNLPLVSLSMAIISALMMVLAYQFFLRYSLNKKLSGLRDVVGMFLIVFVVVEPINAVLNNLVFWVFYDIRGLEFLNRTVIWWFGNSIGTLLLASAILLAVASYKKILTLNFLMFVFGFFVLSYLVFLVLSIQSTSAALVLTLPFFVYVLFKKGLAETMVLLVILSYLSFYFNQLGAGLFLETNYQHSLDLKFYILFLTLLILVVGTLLVERNDALKKIANFSLNDRLTGLPNQHLLNQILSFAIARVKRNNKTCAVCRLDVDDFKIINESLGYHAGDEILKIVSSRINSCIRELDSLVKMDDGQFILVLPDMNTASEVEELLIRVVMSMEEKIVLDNGLDLNVSLSIGVALFPNDSFSADDLLEVTHKTVEYAKLNGGNNIIFYDKIV